jgi:butyrate kinase
MSGAEFRILAINPSSTSTKVAVYENERPLVVKNIRHSDAELEPFRSRPILDQHDFRTAQIECALAEAGMPLSSLHAVVGRGGLLPPLASGTYLVNPEMLEELRLAKRGEHASNLGAWIAQNLAHKSGSNAYIVDPVSVEEWPEIARFSGTALLERQCLSHALNSKAVAKRYARERGQRYDSLRLIVAHLGSGISISAHRNARMIDVSNPREEGAFSTERAGGVPVMQFADLCFSGKYTRKQIDALLFRDAGLYSYVGTKDLIEIERRIAAGDASAKMAFDAMAYQIAKEIAAMAAVLKGRVDAVLLTGGMAHSKVLVSQLTDSIGWIAPVSVYAGEDELQALTEGVLRVLRREETAQIFGAGSREVVEQLGAGVL